MMQNNSKRQQSDNSIGSGESSTRPHRRKSLSSVATRRLATRSNVKRLKAKKRVNTDGPESPIKPRDSQPIAGSTDVNSRPISGKAATVEDYTSENEDNFCQKSRRVTCNDGSTPEAITTGNPIASPGITKDKPEVNSGLLPSQGIAVPEDSVSNDDFCINHTSSEKIIPETISSNVKSMQGNQDDDYENGAEETLERDNITSQSKGTSLADKLHSNDINHASTATVSSDRTSLNNKPMLDNPNSNNDCSAEESSRRNNSPLNSKETDAVENSSSDNNNQIPSAKIPSDAGTSDVDLRQEEPVHDSSSSNESSENAFEDVSKTPTIGRTRHRRSSASDGLFIQNATNNSELSENEEAPSNIDSESESDLQTFSKIKIKARRKTAKAKAAANKDTENIAPKPKARIPWSEEDQQTLLNGIEKYGCSWSNLSEFVKDWQVKRDQVALKDKARNMKVAYLKSGHPLPKNFDKVRLGKKEIEAVRRVIPDYEPEN